MSLANDGALHCCHYGRLEKLMLENSFEDSVGLEDVGGFQADCSRRRKSD